MSRILIVLIFLTTMLYADEALPRITFLNQKTVTEKISSLVEGICVLASGEKINIKTITEISFADSVSVFYQYPALYLRNGSILYVDDFVYQDSTIAFSFAQQKVQLPASDLKGVLFKSLKGGALDKWLQSLADVQRKSDRVFVLKKDEMISADGAVLSVGTDKMSFSWEDSEKTVTKERLAGILLAGSQDNEKPMYELTLMDGSILYSSTLTFQNGIIQCTLSDHAAVLSLPISLVEKIKLEHFFLRYLSDLEPTESYSENLLIPHKINWAKDSSLYSHPLQIQHLFYPKGLGVHSYSRLSFAIEKGYSYFMTDYGLDAGFKDSAGCTFKVLVDGKEILNQMVRGNDAARKLNYKLPEGSKMITLILDYGPNLDIGDFGVWGNARLAKDR